MTASFDEFMADFTPAERARVAARTAELIAEELSGCIQRRIVGIAPP
jgi:hypothetical protein